MTRANDVTPVRRIVRGRSGDEYVVQLFATVVTIRPKGTRSGKVSVCLEWGQLFQRSLIAKLEADAKAKRAERKARRRGRSR